MVTVGVDNGLSGGLAAYSDTGILTVAPMPIITMSTKTGHKNEYDIPAIIQWFSSLTEPVRMVVLEKAHAFPGMSAQSTFANGRNVGIMEGILAALKLPYVVVHSKTWQKKVFEGIRHDDTKQASILVAQRLFPGISFLPSDRSKKASDGMTDAALMAYYGNSINK